MTTFKKRVQNVQVFADIAISANLKFCFANRDTWHDFHKIEVYDQF